jgi:lon-related putative ATP-dependent protease
MTSIRSLPPDQLFRRCDPGLFGFATSAELEGLDQMLGQARAVEAIQLGTEIDLKGFNLFVLGPPGTGRHSFIRDCLKDKAAGGPPAADWCYVNNFDEPRKPKAIELPAGTGRRLRDDIRRMIEEARSAVPTAFESEDYHKRRQAIEREADEEQEYAFKEVQKNARERGIGIAQTATGFNFVPLHDGEPITPEQYRKLSDDERERLQNDTARLSEELRKMLQAIPRRVRKVREKISELDHEVALFAVGGLIEELADRYAEFPKVVAFLERLQQDIADNVGLFTQGSSAPSPSLSGLLKQERPEDPQATVEKRYAVNLLVDNGSAKGAPVVFEDHPTHPYLIGQIEHVSHLGTLTTDFTLIRAGALHRANGGYLVLDARKILTQPFAWDALKRALNAQEIDVKSLAQAYSLVSTVSLEPEPIPLNVKVVIIGDRMLYHLLQQLDAEFPELFKVAADFEDDMVRNDENIHALARLIGTIARQEGLKPLDRHSVAAVIEESSRHAGDAEMLSTRIRRVADIVREAHYWASRDGHDVIGAADIRRAIDGRLRRMSRIHDRLMRETLRNTILIDSDGDTVGQINGLAAMQLGEHVFGRPTRITARLSLGTGKVIDIEREVELGGPIHSKGVLILSNFLSSHYVTDRPLSLSASLVFEQSYGLIEGDSASAAELCVLLSALARVPIRQSIAITGSVNQHGRVQPIGAVNEKIEGFFDLCEARGLSGVQGVVIPAENVKHLMLRRRVVDAVAQGQFQIFAAASIDDCMAILTGVEPGTPDAHGNYPPDSVNGRVTARLLEFADKRREFASREPARPA